MLVNSSSGSSSSGKYVGEFSLQSGSKYITADCTGISGYSSLTADNFAIWPTQINVSCGARSGSDTTNQSWEGSAIEKTYNASTGTLQILVTYKHAEATARFKKLKVYVVS